MKTGEVCAQSDSVSNVQTANPVKVETDMGDEGGSVEDVKTGEMCAQSQVHNAEITDTSVNEVLTVSDDQVKVDVSDDSHVHCPEINDTDSNDVHMPTGDPVNIDISKGSMQNAEDAENDGQQNMDKASE